jgi:hypothetical protein
MRARIRGGEDLNGMDLRAQTAPSFRISGQVTSLLPVPTDRSGSPIPVKAALALVNRDMNVPNEFSSAYRFGGNIPLAPLSGPFVLTNVEPGSYELFARISDYGQGTVWGRATVDVGDRDVHNVSISVDRSVDLRGVVKLAGNARLPERTGVMLMPEGSAAKIPQYQSIMTRATTVGPDGAFLVSGMPPGRFRLRALTGLPPDLYVADVRRDGQSVFDSGFEVGSNASDPIEILVSAGSATVEGAVLAGPTKPLTRATVALIPEDQRRENRAFYLSAKTDAAGRFKIQGVAPGSYKLFAWESVTPNAFLDASFVAPFEERGRVIQIGPGETITADLTAISPLTGSAQ